MDKVRSDRHRAFRTLAGLVEAVELEGVEEFNVVRRGGVWYLTCAARPAPGVDALQAECEKLRGGVAAIGGTPKCRVPSCYKVAVTPDSLCSYHCEYGP